jgi:hypothetical protein
MDFAEALRKAIRDDMNNYADDIAGGGCGSFENYRYLCGVVRGLAQAERHLLDLQQAAEEAQDHE